MMQCQCERSSMVSSIVHNTMCVCEGRHVDATSYYELEAEEYARKVGESIARNCPQVSRCRRLVRNPHLCVLLSLQCCDIYNADGCMRAGRDT